MESLSVIAKAVKLTANCHIIIMACSEYVYNQKKNGYGITTWTDKMETVTLFNNLHAEFSTSLLNIIAKYPEEKKAETIYLYELIAKHYKFMLDNGSLANKTIWTDKLKDIHIKWHAVDTTHEIPYFDTQPAQKSGGCYVATAVYGSYDCPEVWTLRRFRDNTLANTVYGRAFIRTYYAISPTLVKWFGETEWFKKMWKSTLDKMVNSLQLEGVENTPYEDKEW